MSYTKLIYHCTFSTKERTSGLCDDMRPHLYAYIAKLINNDFGFAREVGGVCNHVHILCDIRPSISISVFMSKVKSLSSGWMHREFHRLGEVIWQEGYGAFSVSVSAVPDVREYIKNQELHHKRISFEEELRLLLEKHGVDYNDKYFLS